MTYSEFTAPSAVYVSKLKTNLACYSLLYTEFSIYRIQNPPLLVYRILNRARSQVPRYARDGTGRVLGSDVTYGK